MAEAAIDAVTESCAWTASDFAGREQWARPFTDTMIDEVDAAVRKAKEQGLSYWELTPATFELSETVPILDAARRDLDEGPGFAVLSGFPVDRYDYDENLLAYCGLCAYLGEIADQTHKRDKLQDVIDKGLPYNAHSRAYSGNAYIPFHTDGADVTGLFCLGTAAEGGESLIVSTAAIHNEFKASRPDLLDCLFRGFRYHRRGEEAPGEPPVSEHFLPVFSFEDGLFSGAYNRYPIEWAQDEIGPLNETEIAALDLFDSIANRPDMHMAMDFQQGELQFVNNHVVLHSRTAYRDDDMRRRHLVRIWLNIPNSARKGVTTVTLYAPWSQRGGAG